MFATISSFAANILSAKNCSQSLLKLRNTTNLTIRVALATDAMNLAAPTHTEAGQT